MSTHNLQLTLESDGATYKERQQICLNAVATGDMQKAYKLMVVVMRKLISKSPNMFDANDRLADVQTAASALVVDGLCDEIRYELLHAQGHQDTLVDVHSSQTKTKAAAATTGTTSAKITTTSTALPSRSVPDDVIGVLRRSRLEDCKLYLPPQALDRNLYTSTRDVLIAMGGKWTAGKTQAFVFAEADPASFEVAFAGLLETGAYTDPKDMSFFPTPDVLAAKLVALSGLQPGMTVCEPSAGRGAIALKAAAIVGIENVKCFELYPPNARALERSGFTVVESDFLAMQPPLLEADKFDVILLNPPFSNHQDAAHVAHACRFVKSTGRVAAITSTAWAQQENNRKANEFRTFVAQVDGFVQQVPAGTFKASGTMVPTQILVIEGANLPWYQAERRQEDDTDGTEGEEELAMTESPSA